MPFNRIVAAWAVAVAAASVATGCGGAGGSSTTTGTPSTTSASSSGVAAGTTGQVSTTGASLTGSTSGSASSSGASGTSTSSGSAGTTSGAAATSSSTGGPTTSGGCVPYSFSPRLEEGVAQGADGRVYIVGGLDENNNATALVEAFDPDSGVVTLGQLPTARYDLAVAANADGRVYAAGGALEDGGVTGALEVYDPDAGSWSALPPMPVPSIASGGFSNNHLYVLIDLPAGGQRVDVYDPALRSWAMGPTVPMQDTGLEGVAGNDGNFYVLLPPPGGVVSRPTDAGIEFAVLSNGSWSLSPPGPVQTIDALAGAGLAAVGGTIDLVGGGGAGGAVSDSLFVYDPSDRTWTTPPAMPTARGWLSATEVNGTLYAVDGQSIVAAGMFTNFTLGLIESFNPTSMSWSTSQPMCAEGTAPVTNPYCPLGVTPADAGGACGGLMSESQTPMTFGGGAFQLVSPTHLLVRMEFDCGVICADALSACGYQWLDFDLETNAGLPLDAGTFTVSGAPFPTGNSAFITYVAGQTENASGFGDNGVVADTGGTVTLTAFDGGTLAGTFSFTLPAVADGGQLVYDGGVEVMLPYAGSFAIPAASCTLTSLVP